MDTGTIALVWLVLALLGLVLAGAACRGAVQAQRVLREQIDWHVGGPLDLWASSTVWRSWAYVVVMVTFTADGFYLVFFRGRGLSAYIILVGLMASLAVMTVDVLVSRGVRRRMAQRPVSQILTQRIEQERGQ